MSRRSRWLAAVVGLSLVIPLVPATSAVAQEDTTTAAPGQAGEVRTIPDWRMQTSRSVTGGGDAISRPGFNDVNWLKVPARSTVMAGLIANRKYPDLNHSTNMKQVNSADFAVPWWYRKGFTADPVPGGHTFLKLNGGILSRGEVWLNGTKLAGTDKVIGAYPIREFDVTNLIRKGDNAIALRADSVDPKRDLTIHFIDWAQFPPDRNQGMFRDVTLAGSGAVALRNLRVDSDLPLPSLTSATVTVKVDARNNTDRPQSAEVSGTVDGQSFRQQLSLGAKETRTATFTLKLDKPRVWWPFQMGEQPLYEASVSATVGGSPSDAAKTTFGIREIDSKLLQGGRQFFVNGQPFLVRGGGWASDLFLRTDLRKIEDQLKLTKAMGMNTIRLEGKPENDEFYDMADRMGIMLLTGWECCSKWESYDTFTAEDNRVAGESAESEARRIRNHPSMIGFLIGSDFAPPAAQEKIYLDALRRAEWNLPVISSAKALASPQLGSPGMKMEGPYWWVPPNYWYNKQKGGASGFASEIGPGPTIPELDSLRKFLPPNEIDALRDYNAKHYHLAPSDTFSKLSFWGTALDGRYGKPTSTEDLVRKAQLANYEVNRAQLEAFGRNWSDADKPSTGVIYWMLNSAWPTLYWNLIDHNLATGGSYFGAKTAMRPLHVQYSYDDNSLAVVNTGLRDVSGLSVQATVFNLDGTQKADISQPVTAKANASVRAGALPQPGGLSSTYFVRLLLKDASGKVVDRNVYWLSTKADKLNYAGSTWYHTPQTEYADLKGLNNLPQGSVTATAQTTAGSTKVTITNNGDKVAFFVRVSLRAGAGGPEVHPTTWSDNYVTLWPGESTTVTADYRLSDLGGKPPHVQVSGHNVPKVEVR
ncbi:glycosyl hydrolase 2 galactose-binding domain-containing protein [Allokutzneria albata]|uniref:Exo-1,4-beta-D-glucosaminidase n=1 Tax=Allokutzneria albata TaxID=211114 RepID=A0A1G9ZFA2_ALLAB|nr:glycoside hydrolase family 2 protein [Allokutzneria albata]SDN19988.1 exo-1,4-beta-D-glucosaminidase [Allokutzneria albata]